MTASIVGSLGIMQGPGGGGSDSGVQVSGSSVAGSPDAPPAGTPAAGNDEFASTVLAPVWTWRNQTPTGAGNPTASTSFDGITNLNMTIPPLGAGSGNTNVGTLITQPLSIYPSPTWSVVAKVQAGVPLWSPSAPSTGPNGAFGIALYESSTGKSVIVGPDTGNGIGWNQLSALNNPVSPTGSFPIGPSAVSYLLFLGTAHYLRVSAFAGSYYLWWSATGRSWTLMTSFTFAAHFTVQADSIGLGLNQRSTASALSMTCDFFRNTSAQLAP